MLEYKVRTLNQFADYLEQLAKDKRNKALQPKTLKANVAKLVTEANSYESIAIMVRNMKVAEHIAALDLLEGIRAALDTEETGSNLIEVARAACHAERALAALEHKIASDCVDNDLDS
jgi:hypothetical protein